MRVSIRGLTELFVHHHNTAEGKYWNPALDSFTAENWREKVREIAALKMEYISRPRGTL